MTQNARDTHQSIADWVGDIVALESHVEEAMDRQLPLTSSASDVSAAFKRFHDTVLGSKRRAEAYQQEYGSTSGNPIIKAGSNLLGKAAGMIDQMRTDSASKALRDDYTAYNHLAISYTMLHASALAFNDTATAQFAKQGLTTYAGLVQEINHLISDAVVADLADNKEESPTNTNISSEAKQVIDSAWSKTSA